MDVESDESERWEDFFGSSTDLTPSLIRFYDKLTCNNFNGDSEHAEDDDKHRTVTSDSVNIPVEKEIEVITSSVTANKVQSVGHAVSNGLASKHCNFRILSPNVQRLISNSNSTVDRIENGLVQYHNLNNSCLAKPGKRVITKQKLSHIPLSRNTCKLTQAGTELVETFDSNSLSSNESLDSLHSLTNKSTANITVVDNDKTPTNSFADNFRFDSSIKIQTDENLVHEFNECNRTSNLDCANKEHLSELESLNSSTDDLHRNESNRITEIVQRFHEMYTSTLMEKDEILKDTMSPAIENNIREIHGKNGKTTYETFNFLVRKPNQNQSVDSVNNYVNKVKPTRDNIPQHNKLSPPSSPLLTYSRTKKLSAGKPTQLFLKSGRKHSSSSSLENEDTISELKPQPSSPNNNRSPAHILVDMAKYKHRPLSSSSIGSTSSTSSSGSDHHPHGKLAISYLASVESLADHSENELLGSNTSLTVFKRTCMEIVDSERTYVKDLFQIIDGYLTRWKKDASLKEDDLKVLFSNIQDIHSFNSDLMEQLIDAGMDPVKIAKCFIDLKDRFDVYTTYCTSYPEAIGLLTTLLKATHTNTLLTLTQKSLNHTLPLGSYLLKPVQRILKYHLLLDNLRKQCDIDEVIQAHAIMRKVAWNIDQVKKKLEQKSRVKELYSILDGWMGPDLTVLGELKQEGILMENNKPRHVFLFQTMLIITKPKEDYRLQFKSYIYRNNLMLREHLPCEPTSFNVIPYDDPRNQIKLTAKNRDQKREWTQNIKDVMLEQFDIPSRAKELVYKLGDEEDRTPDKNTWKWGSNSTTPVYLERRNQYRRSEMRNRSKMKRKTISNSTSLEGFSTKKEQDDSFLRKQSMDDNMMPSLLKFSVNSFDAPNPEKPKPGRCNHNKAVCRCSLIRQEFEELTANGNSMKERSKSVPRIPGTGDSDEDCNKSTENISKKPNDSHNLYNFSTLGRSKAGKFAEVKLYTTKTIPKRIATLKKNKTRKETSKFYMDLNDFDDTVLKITESSENIHGDKKQETKIEERVEQSQTPSASEEVKSERAIIGDKLKKDAEIISELLKASMNRVARKPPKKRHVENSISISNSDLGYSHETDNTPPPPPSNSPPPLDLEEAFEENADDISDHIYESLRRNVHVPYKFSPVLNRSKSQQYYTSTSKMERKEKSLPRPESDYVTLIYSESGDLKGVGETAGFITSRIEALRNSDSNINYESIVKSESTPTPSQSFSSVGDLQAQEVITSRASKNLLQRFISAKGEHHVSTSESSLLPRANKATETAGLGRGNKPPERRVSDVTEMCRQSIIHRQGSQAVGERMANLDYADPRTLFTSSINNSAVSLDPQRDSVFSLTSSNDSVCDNMKNSPIIEENTNGTYYTYEENVEACLENDFRDSAVYSDDNDRRQEYEHSEYAVCTISPPPLPKKQSKQINKASSISTNCSAPPPIPAKPHFILPKRPVSGISTGSKSPEVHSPNASDGKSWVLKQINNFNK